MASPLLRREPHVANVECFKHLKETPPNRTLNNVMKWLDAHERHPEQPLPREFALRLLTESNHHTLEGWLRGLPALALPSKRERARWLVKHLRDALAPRAPKQAKKKKPTSLTFKHTATRAFEEDYWNMIAHLSTGDYVNKNNADCVLDKNTQALLKHTNRDLEKMGDYLLDYYEQLIEAEG